MQKRSISKSVIWQLIGKILLQGIAFITTPIFTRILSTSDYGYVALYNSWLSILMLIEGLQVSGSIGNARIKYGEENLNSYISSIMSISLISFLITLMIGILFRKPISNLLGLSSSMEILVIVHSFFYFVLHLEITRFDQLKKVEKSTIFSLFQAIIVIVLSLIFVLSTKGDKAVAKIYGQAIPIIVFGIVIIILIYIRGKKIWNSEYNKFCLSFTLPLIVHGAGHLIFSQSDRIMLQKIQGEEILGIYSVTFSLCSVLTIIFGAFNTAWIPFYYDLKKQNKEKEILEHSKRYIKFCLLIFLGFILLSFDAYKIMAPKEYYDGMRIIPFFVLSHFFAFLYLFPVNFEFYNQKTKLIPIATFLAAIINIVINWLLIPTMGIVGAAIGTVCAHILLYLFHEIMANKIGKENYEYKNKLMFVFPIIILSFVCLLMFFVPELPIWIRWPIALGVAIYVLIDLIKHKSFF